MNEIINKGISILLGWKTNKQSGMQEFIANFYAITVRERSKALSKRFDQIAPNTIYIDNWQDLLDTLLAQLGESGLRSLLIYLLENDKRYENGDTYGDYQSKKPYPSYLVQFAYLLLMILPKGIRNRELFDVFWEHQSKIRPGIDEQYARKYLNDFVDEGIITKDEIRALLLRDWRRWQEAPLDSPYYGASLGPRTWYFPNYSWGAIEKKLEDDWRKETGKEPKK